MSYVTRARVQVELKAGNDEIEIRIDPVQDYSVKHEKDDLIVFVNDDPNVKPLRGVAFIKTQRFRTAEKSLLQLLIDAALHQKAIEIKISNDEVKKAQKVKKAPKSGSDPSLPPDPIASTPLRIESIKLPEKF